MKFLLKKEAEVVIGELLEEFPKLSFCENSIREAISILKKCYQNNGKLLICGNGGSAADSEHMVGELMKGFDLKRRIKREDSEKIKLLYPDEWEYISKNIQGALSAISLVSQTAYITAFINDASPEMVFAQQVYGYGRRGDVLLGISTSGNSINIVNAVKIAKVFELDTIGFTGIKGGLLEEQCDVVIKIPEEKTFRIQEYQLPIYHAICRILEIEFFN
jgi:phosphoheptose isomerase